MSYDTLSGANWSDPNQLPALLQFLEGSIETLYNDGSGNPTIGIGLNLMIPDDMAVVLNQFTYNGLTIWQAAAQNGQSPQQVIAAFEELMPLPLPKIGTSDANSTNQNQATIDLENALN